MDGKLSGVNDGNIVGTPFPMSHDVALSRVRLLLGLSDNLCL